MGEGLRPGIHSLDAKARPFPAANLAIANNTMIAAAVILGTSTRTRTARAAKSPAHCLSCLSSGGGDAAFVVRLCRSAKHS